MYHPTPLGYHPREIRENFMHANISCYTVMDRGVRKASHCNRGSPKNVIATRENALKEGGVYENMLALRNILAIDG